MKKAKINLILFLILIPFSVLKAGVIIDPAGDGGFENGNTFAANNWQVVNGTNPSPNPNQWFLNNTGQTGFSSNNCAFISNNGGVSNSYTNGVSCYTHIYRDVTVPAGQSQIFLSFDWICNGEMDNDGLQVAYALTSVTPSASSITNDNSTQTTSVVTNATLISTGTSGFLNLKTSKQKFTAFLPEKLVNSTFRLIFTWRNNSSSGLNTAAAIDNILLYSGSGRGMYVDNFFTLADPNNPPSSAVVPALTILGISANENTLFDFCNKNNITSIVLYDLRSVFASNHQSDLCNFIANARLHGIEKIGGTVGSSSAITDNKNLRLLPTPAYNFSGAEISYFNNPLNASKKWVYDLVVNSHSESDPEFTTAELLKDFFNISRLSLLGTCSNNEHFDFITLEYEFWNVDHDYNSAQTLIDAMYDAKVAIQAVHAWAHLETEIYLGNIGNVGGQAAAGIDTRSNYIDGKLKANTTTPILPDYLMDRMLFTTYGNKPDQILVNGSSNYYDDVYNAFENSSSLRPTPYHPLLSSCSIDLGFGDEGFAKWFRKSDYNNIFSAERIYYDLYKNYSSSATAKNLTNPGSARWYTYSQMIEDNFEQKTSSNHTRAINTFYTNSPVICSNGNTTAAVQFTYSGPIEDGVTVSEFKIFETANTSNFTILIPNITSASATNATLFYGGNGVNFLNLGSQLMAIGDYTAVLKLTFPNGKTNTCSLAVKVLPFPTSIKPDLVIIGSSTICDNGAGTDVTLKAPTIAGVTSYKWYKTATTALIANTQQVPYYTLGSNSTDFSGPGPYSFYCKITYGATNLTITTNDILITKIPNPVPVIKESALDGHGVRTLSVFMDNLSTPYPLGTGFLWSRGTLTTPSISTLSTGYIGYDVWVTNLNGCVNTASLNVKRIECAGTQFSFQFATASGNDNNLNNYASTLTSISTDAVIKGDFIIDRNFLISGDITCISGSKIIVKNGAVLTINGNANVHACDKMWKGIEVEAGGTLVISDNARIADAEFGVTALEGSLLNINGGTSGTCTFENCYQGILFPSYTLPRTYTINKTKITSSGTMTLPYSGQTTTIGAKTTAGISILGNATLTLTNIEFDGIGSDIIANNAFLNVSGVSKFLNSDNALIGTNSAIVNITAATFTNIKNASTLNTTKAIDISGASSSLVLTTSTFTDCEIAISTTLSGGNINGNAFNNCPRAINIVSPNSKSVRVNHNNIANTLNGIELSFADQASRIEISSNTVTCGATAAPASTNLSYGIKVDGSGANSHNFYSLITTNNVTLISAGKGISLTYKNKAFVVHNNITLQNGNIYMQKGISLETCLNFPVVSCNYVRSNVAGMVADHYGLFFSTNDRPSITCNTSIKAGSGFRFEGSNNTVHFTRNEMVDNHYGLDLFSNAFISDQIHQSNYWIGTFTKHGFNNSTAQGNQFKVNPDYTLPINPFYPTLTQLNGLVNWFKDETTVGERACNGEHYGPGRSGWTAPYIDCATPSSIPPAEGRIGNIDVSDSTLLIDSLKAREYLDETNFIARQRLYSRIIENPELKDNNSLIEQFFIQSDIEKWGTVERMRIDEVNYDDASRNIIFNIQQNDSIILYYQNLIAFNDSIGDSLHIAQNEQIYTQMRVTVRNNDLLTNLLNNSELTRKQLLQNANLSITGSSLIEHNQLVVNDIYLRTIGVNQFDLSKEITTLQEIAHQCPHSGGMGVYMARNMLALVSPNEYYDDLPACLVDGYFRKTEIKKDITKSGEVAYFIISPNPASGLVKASYFITNGSSAKLVFYNSLMQVVKILTIDDKNKEQNIDCSGFNNGIYFYSLTVNQNIIKQGKLSIINQ